MGMASAKPRNERTRYTIKSNAKGKDNDMPKKPKVAIVMGSDSVFPYGGCLNILRNLMLKLAICSAHRTPDRAGRNCQNAESGDAT